MGFIEIAAVNYPDELNGIWNNYIDISKMKTADVISEFTEKISDGMRFFIGQDQSLVMFSDDKILDYITGPGAFVFHKAFEPGEYTVKGREHFKEVYDKHPEAFGEYSENTKCLIVNMPESVIVPFSFSEAECFDKEHGLYITMDGTGYYEVGMSDALDYFAETGSTQTNYTGLTQEDIDKLTEGFDYLLKSELVCMENFNIDYNMLIYNTDFIVNCINIHPQIRQYLKPGAEIKAMEFSSIYPDEESMKLIIEIVRSRRGNGVS